jgi:uncharacterized Zn finger protein
MTRTVREPRGFPALPPRRGATRGRNWWSRAWVGALEDTSLDAAQLRRGRRLAGAGVVGPLTLSPGRIGAQVDDGGEARVVAVHLPELDDAAWARFHAQVAAEAGHLAALGAGEMPRTLVTAADAAGVELLPGIGDLTADCDCPEWGDPCPHAAAVCYQVAWLLDEEPTLLLLLRGRDRTELLGTPPAPDAQDAPDPDRLAALVDLAAGRARALLAAHPPPDEPADR